MSSRVLNYAHRGARSLAPENSLPAIEKALEIGCDGVEVDIRRTKDGELVLIHDATLVRTTNVSELFPDREKSTVSEFTLEELKLLDAGSWFLDSDPFDQIRTGMVSFTEMEKFQECRIPTLEELLLLLKNRDVRINLEIKQPPTPSDGTRIVEETVALLDRLDADCRLISISSFNHGYIEAAQRLNPKIEINALIGAGPDRSNHWGNYMFPVYNANARYFDRKQFEKAKKHGCTVNLYTVNDPEEMACFIDWGVAGIITDFPQTLVSLL